VFAEELPIVDANARLLGVRTEDEALNILADEATVDAEKQGGSAPLEVPYLEASPWLLWRKRIVWPLVLFVAEAYIGTARLRGRDGSRCRTGIFHTAANRHGRQHRHLDNDDVGPRHGYRPSALPRHGIGHRQRTLDRSVDLSGDGGGGDDPGVHTVSGLK